MNIHTLMHISIYQQPSVLNHAMYTSLEVLVPALSTYNCLTQAIPRPQQHSLVLSQGVPHLMHVPVGLS